MASHYETLGVARDADQATIRKAYRRLAMRYHPDRCKEPDADDRMTAIQLAYDTLSDPKRRARYDETGDDTIEKSVDQRACAYISRAFHDFIRQADLNMDPVRTVRHGISETVKAMRKRLSMIDVLPKRRGKVLVKGEEANLYEAALDQMEKAAVQERPQLQEQIVVLERALEILANYELKKEKLTTGTATVWHSCDWGGTR